MKQSEKMGRMGPYANATETRHPEGIGERQVGISLNRRAMLRLHLPRRTVFCCRILKQDKIAILRRFFHG